jgi:hypothetical protein
MRVEKRKLLLDTRRMDAASEVPGKWGPLHRFRLNVCALLTCVTFES